MPFSQRSSGLAGGASLRRGISAAWLLAVVLPAIDPACLEAADKNGVSPNVISLPKGPGSIEGLGESFQPNLNTGTTRFSIPLKTPPGTRGHAPALRLVYDGGSGNGPLGIGWNMPMPEVQRQTDQGIPTYGENLGIGRDDGFIDESREELVPTQSGFYFHKNEGAFIRYRQVAGHWESCSPSGFRSEFGVSPGARIRDTNGPVERVFSWLLERETDPHGNEVVYEWTGFPGANDLNQRYLTSIRFGAGASPWTNFHFVRFVYETRPDWFEDCRSGFPVRTGQRLKAVVIGSQGPVLEGHQAGDFNQDGITDYLVRRYDLNYADHGPDAPWSLLRSVQQVGANGVDRLPATTFDYATSDLPDTLPASGAIIGGMNEPPLVMDSDTVDLVDLNGDGLPDVLRTYEFGGGHLGFLNLGEILTNGVRQIRWGPPIDLEGDPQASAFWLSSSEVHMADMDGDGLADLVTKTVQGDVAFFPNRGRVSWGTRSPMVTGDFAPPAPFGETDVRTADLDFDKNIDLIRGDGSEYQVWLNLGGQDYSPRITVADPSPFDLALPDVHIADINGDRVPDLARVRADHIVVTVGLGYGRFAPPRMIPIPDEVLDSGQITACVLSDITGDGLADLVLERAVPGQLWFWVNLGNDTFTGRKTLTGMPSSLGMNARTRWADLNGNGTTDLIYADSTGNPRMQTIDLRGLFNGGLTPNTLIRMDNGLGRVVSLEYRPSTAFALEDAARGMAWTNPIPNPVVVVSAITNSDSLGHHYVTRFHYHEGYYDPVEKQFRGFAHVEQIDIGDASAPTLVTRTLFDVGRQFESMKGRILALSTETEDGRRFWTETNQWAIPPVNLYPGTNGDFVTYAHPKGRARIVSELGNGSERRTEVELGFDRYGNQTTNADFGVVEGGNRLAYSDERIIVTRFLLNTNAWILRCPGQEEIRDGTGAVFQRTEYFYDDETFSAGEGSLPVQGNRTLTRQWADPAGSAGPIAVSRVRYDHFGNPILLLDALASAPGGVLDLSRGHVRELAYDTRFHTYPVTETVHLGGGKEPLVFRASYNEGLGTMKASTDANTNTTFYGHDSFGRLTRIVKPGDSTTHPTVEYDYVLSLPLGSGRTVNFLETRHRDKDQILEPRSSMYLVSREYVDGLGRKLLTKQEAGTNDTGAPCVVVQGATLFNSRQKPSVVFNPFYSTLPGTLDQQLAFESIESPGWSGLFQEGAELRSLVRSNAQCTVTDFDATLREVRTLNQDGTRRTITYEPLVTRIFDENDTQPGSEHSETPAIQHRDGLGRLVRVDETARLADDGAPGPLAVWSTRYEYDPRDQLRFLIDSQGNRREFRYDGLKRKVLMNDPDCGIQRWTFDDCSNLIETWDARNQRITWTYDGANRILTEDFHDTGLPGSANRSFDPLQPVGPGNQPDVQYVYDAPQPGLDGGDTTIATARHTRGLLSMVRDLAGEEHLSYDARGRVEYVVKRIPDPLFWTNRAMAISPHWLISFKTRFEYDSLDRIQGLVYPDNDEVRYAYNDRSLLSHIRGVTGQIVLSNLTYWPSGRQREIVFGNQVHSSYHHDSRMRLVRLHTTLPGAATELLHYGYSFDGVSNIRSIQDLRPGSAVPPGDPRRNTQSFSYDDLYRITQVRFSFQTPGGPLGDDGSVSYRYDRLGNLLAQTSTLEHQENGLPVAALGTLDYGGSSGRWNRNGRSPSDPPGPHALTRITSATPAVPQRSFEYDSNGNMLAIDGKTNTWDARNRLVVIEDNRMRADYVYDYMDRRVMKRVFWKEGDPRNAVTNAAIPSVGQMATTTSVLYPGKHFEVREHDAPVKYVWNGETRVARVSGFLSGNPRVHRLRLVEGWNLVCLGVTGSLAGSHQSGTGVDGVVSGAFQYRPASLDWAPISTSEVLPAGTVLWVHATTNAVLHPIGSPAALPNAWTVPADGGFIGNPGPEPVEFNRLASGGSLEVLKYLPGEERWTGLWPVPRPISTVPPSLVPGEVLFIRSPGLEQLSLSPSVPDVLYYHQDHLGSSAALSDQNGELVEEMAYYPYGALRHSHRGGAPVADYCFTQKERDRETQWDYFEARFYVSALARFTRPDPLTREPSPDSLLKPQMLNSYAYCSGQPLSFRDPSGMEEEAAEELLDSSAKPKDPPTKIQRIKSFFKNLVNFEKKASFKIGPVGIDNEGEASIEYGPAKVAMKNTDEGLQYEAAVGVKGGVETPLEGVGVEIGVEASATVNIQPDANKKTIGSVWAGIKAFFTTKAKLGGEGDAAGEGELAAKAETDKYVLEFRSSQAMRDYDARLEAIQASERN